MSKVSKEMVDAVRLARWEEWERMAKELPDGHHILSVELLRTRRNETAVVLTVARNGRPVQYELRADGCGANPKPVVTGKTAGCADLHGGTAPHIEALTALDASTDEGPIANTIALGSPPIKEPPEPGAVALGTSLLSTTFNLGEQAVDPGAQ